MIDREELIRKARAKREEMENDKRTIEQLEAEKADMEEALAKLGVVVNG